MRSYLIAPALALPLIATAPAWGADIKISVATNDRNGVCRIYLPRESDDMELEISVRARDGNTNVAVHNLPSDWVDGNEDKEITLKLKPKKGKAITTAGGTYVAGVTYRAVGFFETPEDGLVLASLLHDGDTLGVSFDGHDVGAFEIQQTTAPITNYAYNWLHNCVEKGGGPTDF